MEEINRLITCKRLLSLVDKSLHKLLRINVYEDPHFFYDYVIEYNDEYINLCEITASNKIRYEVLLYINNNLKSKYFNNSIAKIIELDGKMWFYENIKKHDIINVLTINELHLFWNNITELSGEVVNLLSNYDITSHNDFFKRISYYEEMKILLSEQAFNEHDDSLQKPYMVFADMEKSFELGRIVKHDTYYVVTGLQSFIPCHTEYVKIVSVIYSSFNDTDENIMHKLEIVNNGKLELIISAIKDQLKNRPSYYVMNKDILQKHLNRLDLLCKKLQ